MKQASRMIVLALVFALLIITPNGTSTHAQRIGTFAKSNYSTVVTENNNFRLDIYFNLVDGVGQVLPNAEVERVDITLQNNTEYSFEPTQPLTPFYITLVLDVSGSMAGRANVAMREAVQQSLENAPDNAQFSVITFHDEINTLQEFTGQTAVVRAALSTLQAVNGGGTCLYDAMWNALNKTKTVPTGRRAVIVFTDGVDENANGDPCSVVSLNDVIDEARANQIPLYTIGLEGQGSGGTRVNTDELKLVADSTGGLSFSGIQEDLGSLFGAIMEALSSQWYIQATMYPDEGDQVASMLPILAGGQEIDEPLDIAFNSPRAFRQPVACTLEVSLLQFANDVYSFVVNSSVPNAVSTLQLGIITKDTNTPLTSYPGAIGTPIQVPLNQLQYGTAYLAQASITSTDASCPPSASMEFTTPPAPDDGVSLELGRISEVEGSFVQEFSVTDPQGTVDSLSFSVADGDTNIRVEGIGGTMLSLDANQLVIPAATLQPQKKYIIIAELFDSSGTRLARTTGEFSTGAPPPAPVVQVVSIEPIERDKDVVVNLEWLNQDDSADVTQMSAVLIDPTNNTEVPNSQIRVESYADRLEFDYSNLKNKQSYNIDIRVNHVGGQEKFTYTFAYNLPSVPLLERLINFILSPIVLAILIALAGIGTYIFLAQRRARRSFAYEVDRSLSHGMDARFGTPSPYNQQYPPAQRQSPPPPQAVQKEDETATGLPLYPKNASPQMRPMPDSTEVVRPAPLSNFDSYAGQDSLSSTSSHDYVYLKVKKAKTPPQLIRANNSQFNVMTREIKFFGTFSIGREKEGPQKCDLILESDLNLSRKHLIVRPLSNDQKGYEIVVEGQNTTRFDGEIIPKGESFLLMPQQEVTVEVYSKDGSEVILEVRCS